MAASELPLPVPPRTPTPPPLSPSASPPSPLSAPVGLGFDDDDNSLFPDPLALSQLSVTFALSADSPRSPASASYYSPMTAGTENSTPAGEANPFNFQPQAYVVGKPAGGKPEALGRRRGHKYKHSSVSHQIFLEPAPRAPLQVAASLPVPTFKELRASLTTEQKWRFAWCACHLAVGAYVKSSAQGSAAMTALSHLVFYDFVGATVCCLADVGGNFEFWRRTSLKRPFGFERFEVLAGLAMAVTLLFTGFDLVSHNIQHAFENSGGHTAHRPHGHERVSAGSVDTAALAAITATLISAMVLQNHARIRKVMRVAALESLPSVLSNPSHLLTLSCSTLLLLLPLLSVRMYIWLDRAITAVVALSMTTLGWKLAWALGRLLMMSYAGPGLEALLRGLEADPAVARVDEAAVWHVHYGLCQANIKLRVWSLEDAPRLRDRIQSLVRNRLAGGYGSGDKTKFEISTQLSLMAD